MGNIHRKNLVVLDIRIPGLYNAGHIPGAVNIPEAEWYANDPGFAPPYEANWMELPPLEDIEDNISKAGITKDSLVVVVGSTSGQLSPMPLALYSTAGITRVAITLLYAGVRNVAILDGGYEKWAMEGKPTTTVFPKITPVTYEAIVNEEMFVDIGYVESAIGKSIIVDARDYIVYSGGVTEPWCQYPGHIPSAVNLPTPELWNIKEDDAGNAVYITYKDMGSLKRMIFSVIGNDKNKEIIVYCGVGGYASTAYFVLSEELGYRNIKFYDGSARMYLGE
ncbi:MAG: rhodanese-like domain-containing protein [Candidatus Bathyarchaeia archaeon]